MTEAYYTAWTKISETKLLKEIFTRKIPTVQPICSAACHICHPQKQHILIFVFQCPKIENKKGQLYVFLSWNTSLQFGSRALETTDVCYDFLISVLLLGFWNSSRPSTLSSVYNKRSNDVWHLDNPYKISELSRLAVFLPSCTPIRLFAYEFQWSYDIRCPLVRNLSNGNALSSQCNNARCLYTVTGRIFTRKQQQVLLQ
jgi:hypothetical protein